MNRQVFVWVTILLLTITGLSSAQQRMDTDYELIGRVGRGTIRQLQFSQDNLQLAAFTTRGIWLYDATDLSIQPRLVAPDGLYTMRRQAMSINADFTQIAGLNEDGIVSVWDIETGQVIFSFDEVILDYPYTIFDPMGRFIAAISLNQWIIWDLTDGSVQQDGFSESLYLDSPNVVLKQIAINPEGTVLASTVRWIGSHQDPNQYYFASVETGELIETYAGNNYTFTDPMNFGGLQLLRDEGNPTTISVIYPAPELDGFGIFEIPSQETLWNSPYAFSSDGTRFAIAGEHDGLVIWNIPQAQETPPCPETVGQWRSRDYIPPVDYSACDERWHALITSTELHQEAILLDEHDTMREVTTQSYISQDGQWVFQGQVMTHTDGTSIQLIRPDTDWAYGYFADVHFSGSYVIIVWSGYYDPYHFVGETIIEVWEFDPTQSEIQPLHFIQAHDARWMPDSALSPDGTRLITTAGETIIWDVATMTEVGRIDDSGSFNTVAFGEDSQTIFAQGNDGVVYTYSPR